jgi:Domain of unknown function (DUF4375)
MTSDAEKKPATWELWAEMIEPCWDVIDFDCEGDEFAANWAKVPPHVAHLFAIWVCEAEVCNGGLEQFYDNSSGALAPEAVLAFRTLGMPTLAGVVEETIRMIGEPFPRLEEDREEAMSRLRGDDEESDPFDHLDDQYFDAQDTDMLHEGIRRYIELHLAEDTKG